MKFKSGKQFTRDDAPMESKRERHVTKVNARLNMPYAGCGSALYVDTGCRAWNQLHDESMSWIRTIDFLRQENSHLKHRLAEVVDRSTDKEFLAQAEHFQNQFIIKDEFLDEMRHDVNGQERLLHSMAQRIEQSLEESLHNKQRMLRGQMEYLERDFTDLRNEFNNYLEGSL